MAKDILSQDKKVLARKIVLLIYDVFSIYFSGFLALYVGYNFSINDDFMFYLDEFINDSYVLVIITIVVFYIFSPLFQPMGICQR